MKKVKRTRTLLNDIQREAFQLNLFDLSELQLNDYYTLNTLDKKIIFERRTIRWSHINFYGDYLFTIEQVKDISSIQINDV